MKVSIITVVYNGKETIEECIKSVLNQGYRNVVEYIIIDGGSTDGTIEIIRKYEGKIAYWVSEPDNGIYDAVNKGIKSATGDVVGILHSDDIYADTHVIEEVIRRLGEKETDSCYGDLVYVDRNDTNKIIRHWKAGDFYKESFRKGWMPPHPTFFAKRSVYEKYGLLNTGFPLAADYELMVRLLYKYGISTAYVPRVLVKMRTGGTSRPGMYTLRSIRENYRAWKVNGLKYPITLLLKPLSKLMQFKYIP
jgi:glycosyltransferase